MKSLCCLGLLFLALGAGAQDRENIKNRNFRCFGSVVIKGKLWMGELTPYNSYDTLRAEQGPYSFYVTRSGRLSPVAKGRLELSIHKLGLFRDQKVSIAVSTPRKGQRTTELFLEDAHTFSRTGAARLTCCTQDKVHISDDGFYQSCD